MKRTIIKLEVTVEVCSDTLQKKHLRDAFRGLGSGGTEFEEELCRTVSQHVLTHPAITADDIDSVGTGVRLL